MSLSLTRLAALLPLLAPALAQYNLQGKYSGDNFFGAFDFFTAGDPTHGFVKCASS